MLKETLTEQDLIEVLERHPGITISDYYIGRGEFEIKEFTPSDTKKENPTVTLQIGEQMSDRFGIMETIIVCKFGEFESQIVISGGEFKYYGYEYDNPPHLIEVARAGLEIMDVFRRCEVDPTKYEDRVVRKKSDDLVVTVDVQEDSITSMLKDLNSVLTN